MFVVIMSKTIHILLLFCLVVSCNRAQNPSIELTSADSTKYSDTHNHYAGKLSGIWYRNTLGARATLVLEPISPERVRFSITSLSGGNTGEIDGFLAIDGMRATFRTESDEYGSCLLLFDGSVEGSIRLEQEGCMGYGGVGVVFLGLYDRKWTPDETLAVAVLEERFGVDVTRDILFKSGSDFDIVASTMQLEYNVDSDDAFTQITEFTLRGLHGQLTSCIAINSQTGRVWLTYIRDNELILVGALEDAPTAFRKWIDEIVTKHALTLVQKPDPS
jgi:hypothetical protein